MTDIMHYKIPFWFLGDIANSILVRSQLKNFEGRFQAVQQKFGSWPGEKIYFNSVDAFCACLDGV